MTEIQPIAPALPIIRPKKINRDEQHPQQQQHHDQKPAPEQQEPQPMQHIDEVV